MKKRILAAMLTLSMVVSMTACGNSDAGGSKDSAKNNGNGDEPYTVTMVLNGSTQPDEERIEQKINEILEPELNANLDIVVLPWASASQQLQLMLSGDEKIDVFYTQATNAVQYMNAGQIVDMSELIDKYGTNIKQIYGEDIAKINQIEGFVYGVPNQIERGSIPAIFMRKDLVEKYNIDTTQTGLKIQLPCCMTGIRRDISARMQEPTQRTGEQYARLEIYFHCFFLIILEHR